jgi:hypothetical protein
MFINPLEAAVFKRGHLMGVAFPSDLGHLVRPPEMEAMGGTNRNTGGLEPPIDAIHAIIAFNHPPGFRVPLGGTPGAGGNATFAPYAQILIHEDDSVLGSLLHGPGGAGGHAPWIFAVVARHENIGGPGRLPHHFRPYCNDLTQPGPHRKRFVDLALNLTGMAVNAFFYILKQVVLAHFHSPQA